MRHILSTYMIVAFDVLFAVAALFALVVGSTSASGTDGYPAPYVTQTMEPTRWPACWPKCATNTPVVDRLPQVTPNADGIALTPVIGDPVSWPPAVLWLPSLMR